jgi:hypothetical protein
MEMAIHTIVGRAALAWAKLLPVAARLGFAIEPENLVRQPHDFLYVPIEARFARLSKLKHAPRHQNTARGTIAR